MLDVGVLHIFIILGGEGDDDGNAWLLFSPVAHGIVETRWARVISIEANDREIWDIYPISLVVSKWLGRKSHVLMPDKETLDYIRYIIG